MAMLARQPLVLLVLLELLVGNVQAESISPELFTQAEVVIPGQASCYKTPQLWSELFPETVQPPPATNQELQDIVIDATQVRNCLVGC